MDMASDKYILVTGAAGFIGKPTVRHLLRRGWSVKAMVRASRPLPFSPQERLQVVYADLCDPGSLVNALKDVGVVVHLAAAKADEKWSTDVNVGGARRLVDACRRAGCARIINISSQSAKTARKGIYARTKREADLVFENSGLRVTTLLPSVVYGEEKSGVFGTVLKFVSKLPIVPVLGDGKWISAPVYAEDVAEAICLCIERDQTIGKSYDIGGPDLVTFDDFVDRIAAHQGLKRPKLHIPFGIAVMAAKVLVAILPKSPVTVSNVLGSNQNTNINTGPAIADLGFHPLDFDCGLRKVLGETELTQAVDGPGRKEEQYPAPADADLSAECLVFTRYLIDQAPPKELVDRYIAASRVLVPEEESGKQGAELRFVRRHPLALPFLDAAAGILKRKSLLRRKLLLMTAILEATPAYAGFFLSEPSHPFVLACGLIWQGFRSAIKVVLGIPVFWIAQKP